MPDAQEIDAALKADPEGRNPARLAKLHEEAAALLSTAEEQRFHLTHAWVYALVSGNTAQSNALEKRLTSLGGL